MKLMAAQLRGFGLQCSDTNSGNPSKYSQAPLNLFISMNSLHLLLACHLPNYSEDLTNSGGETANDQSIPGS